MPLPNTESLVSSMVNCVWQGDRHSIHQSPGHLFVYFLYFSFAEFIIDSRGSSLLALRTLSYGLDQTEIFWGEFEMIHR